MLAASALGAVGLVSMIGRPLSGTLSDVLGRELVYTVGSGMQMGGIVALLTLGDGQRLWPILLFVALNGLSDGIGGLVVGAKAADLFPTRALGAVMGLDRWAAAWGSWWGRCWEDYCLTSKATTERPIYWRWPWCASPWAVCGGCVLRAARRTTEARPRQPLTGHDADLG